MSPSSARPASQDRIWSGVVANWFGDVGGMDAEMGAVLAAEGSTSGGAAQPEIRKIQRLMTTRKRKKRYMEDTPFLLIGWWGRIIVRLG